MWLVCCFGSWAGVPHEPQIESGQPCEEQEVAWAGEEMERSAAGRSGDQSTGQAEDMEEQTSEMRVDGVRYAHVRRSEERLSAQSGDEMDKMEEEHAAYGLLQTVLVGAR